MNSLNTTIYKHFNARFDDNYIYLSARDQNLLKNSKLITNLNFTYSYKIDKVVVNMCLAPNKQGKMVKHKILECDINEETTIATITHTAPNGSFIIPTIKKYTRCAMEKYLCTFFYF